MTALSRAGNSGHAGLDYLESLDRTFQAAAQRTGGACTWSLDIAGTSLRIHTAGERVRATLMPAIAHRLTPTADRADFDVFVVDAADSGAPLPAFCWRPEDVRERGEVRGFNDARLRTQFDSGSWMLSMLDVARGRAFLAVDGVGRVAPWHRAAPLRTILHWLLESPTRLLVHAAAVGDSDDGGVLLAGAGGSGKSTTAVVCAAAGMGYAGDDYVLVEIAGEPVAHSLYTTAKLTDRSLALLGSTGCSLQASVSDGEKQVIDMVQAFPGSLASVLPLRAIVLPSVEPGAPTRMRRASAGDALRALAPTTIYQLPSNGGRALASLASLARRLPAYSLTIGDGMPAAAEAVSELLRGSLS